MAFPATYNFNYYRGDYHEFVIRPKTANGQQFNLTDFVNGGLYKIAKTRGAGVTQYTGEVSVNATQGTVTCRIPAVEGKKLTPGTWLYDIQITNGSSLIYTILTGTITVTDEISGAA